MKIIRYPKKETWNELLARPAMDTKYLRATVAEILDEVRADGDAALRRFARKFDGVEPENLLVGDAEFADAERQISGELKAAIEAARANIEKFHAAQIEAPAVVETTKGVFCWRKSVPIEKVGLYVPAGMSIAVPSSETCILASVTKRLPGPKIL